MDRAATVTTATTTYSTSTTMSTCSTAPALICTLALYALIFVAQSVELEAERPKDPGSIPGEDTRALKRAYAPE